MELICLTCCKRSLPGGAMGPKALKLKFSLAKERRERSAFNSFVLSSLVLAKAMF
jgi:hypothetical protein